MSLQLLGVILFFGVHAIPAHTGLRSALVGRVGEVGYKAGFALISLAGLVLMGMGFAQSGFVALWEPATWAGTATKIAMWIAFVLLAAAYTPTHIRGTVKHPMMLGVFIWSVTHLISNGEQAALWLFAPFAGFAVFSVVSAEMRGKRLGRAPASWKNDGIALAVGTVAWALVWYFHGALFGVAVMG